MIRVFAYAIGVGLGLWPGSLVEARLFTDDQGRQIEAELIGVNGANVVLERNGQAAQWPIAKLSKEDQMYVKVWLKDPPSSPKIRVNVWEREGMSASGRFEDEGTGPGPPKNIPMLKTTEEKENYRYYDIDLSNLSQVDALNLHLSYVLYVIDGSGQIVDFQGSESIDRIPAEKRVTRSSQAATSVSSKVTQLTLSSGLLGGISTGSETERSKERFGGIWARVYGPDGELLGERKDLHDELERLDFQFTGSTGDAFGNVPLLESFEKLRELLDKLPAPPEGLPKPPGSFPKPPFAKPLGSSPWELFLERLPKVCSQTRDDFWQGKTARFARCDWKVGHKSPWRCSVFCHEARFIPANAPTHENF